MNGTNSPISAKKPDSDSTMKVGLRSSEKSNMVASTSVKGREQQKQ